MQWSAVLAVLCWAAASPALGAPVSPCPSFTPPGQLVFIASNASCSDFYLCSHGVPYLLHCPAGLYFSTETGQCDYQRNVNCTEPTPAPEPATTEAVSTTTSAEPTVPSSTATEGTSTTTEPSSTTVTTESPEPTNPSSTTEPPMSTESPMPTNPSTETTSAAPFLRRVRRSTNLAVGAPVSPCPSFTPPGQLVFIASNASCSDFYLCSHGVPYLLHCPAGLYFSTETGQCDYQRNVNCTEPTPTPEPATTTEAVSTTTSAEPTVPSSTATEGTSTTTAPTTTEPSTTAPTTTTATPEPTTTPSTTEPSTASPEPTSTSPDVRRVRRSVNAEREDGDIACPDTDGDFPVLLPNPANCSTFYMCSHGVPILLSCPEGLAFNNDTWTCDYAQNVDCVQPTDSPADNTTSDILPERLSLALFSDSDGESQCPEVDGMYPVFLPNTANCSTFYMCSHGTAYLQSCPPGLLFNNATWNCDYPQNVVCNQTADNQFLERLTLQESDAAATCPQVDGDFPVFLPNPANCSTFYMCANGVPYLEPCPAGLLFNNATWSCDFPENVDCVQPTESPVNQTGPLLFLTLNLESDASDECPEVDGDFPVFLPNLANCSTFYMCSHGVPFLKSCPADLFFNNDTWTCDYPENVDCVQPTETPDNSTTTSPASTTTANPDSTTTANPDTTTTANPDTTTTANPDTTTTANPDSTTTANPDSTTTGNPDSTTTGNPDSTTTANPDSTTTTEEVQMPRHRRSLQSDFFSSY